MTTLEWVVVLGGVAAIVWVNWYFFLAEVAKEERDQGRGTRDR